jgi:SAM-dependent methyltransferase
MNDETSIKETLVKIKDLYEGNLSQHGVSSKAVGWKDQESQLLRFEKLAEVIPGNTDSYTVVDWGCGYAAMYDFLQEKKPGCKKYYGYDISADMLHKARELHPDDGLELIQSADVTTNADYTFVSGTFNVRFSASDEAWSANIKEVLQKLAEKTTPGLAFNLLTTYVDWKQENLFYADPMEFFDFCKKNLSRKVTLIHDYPLYEWTMLVKL